MNKLIHGPNVAGQSLADRVMAAKHSIAGSGLAKSVCKATTEEIMGPKKKHLDYLIACTNEPNVSIPQLANLLIERTQSHHWVVTFKALVTIHNLMNYGNERFTQYLASNNCTFSLGTFLDKQGVQGYDMSTYIRRYSKYLNEKSLAYRSMAFDFCKVKRGKEDGLLRTMPTEKLLKSLPTLQSQLDSLLEFDVTPNELTNGVINAAFMLLFKDLIRLFACYNDGIINLLEKYFEMNKKQCKEALDVYKRFLVRMERVSELLRVAESVGIDKGDIPDLAKAPSSLLEALEEHLKSLESSKKGRDKPASVAAAVTSFAAASQSAAQVSHNASMSSASGVTEDEKAKILEEEQRHLDRLKEQADKQKPSPSAPLPPSNPFSSASPEAAARPSEDLLGLGGGAQQANPFSSPQQPASAGGAFSQQPAGWGGHQAAPSAGPPRLGTSSSASSVDAHFASDAQFAAVFGSSNGHTSACSSAGPLDPAASATRPPPDEDLFGSIDPSPGAPPFESFGQTAASPVNAAAPLPGALDLDFGSSPSANPPSPAAVDLTLTSAPDQRPVSPSFAGLAGLDMSKTSAPPRPTSPGYGPTLDMSLGATSTPPSGRSASPAAAAPGFDAFGDIMAPQANAGQPQNVPQPKKQSKVITGDLDSSLASLAGNLNMNSGANQIKKMDHQWTASPERKGLTGGQQWAQPGFTGSTFGSNSMQGQGQMPGGFAQQPRMAQPMHPMGGMQPMPAMSMAGGGTQPMPGNPVQWNMMAGQPQHPQGFMAAQPQQMAGQPQQAPQPQHNDPFGAL